jgi:hypothetical protein
MSKGGVGVGRVIGRMAVYSQEIATKKENAPVALIKYGHRLILHRSCSLDVLFARIDNRISISVRERTAL